MYQTTTSTNITGPDKITVTDDSAGSAYYKIFESMRNGDATLLMQEDGNLVSRLKDKVVWQTGVTKAGAKAVLTMYGLSVTTVFQGGKDYWQSSPRIENQNTTRTLNLKTDGHLELFAGSSKVWSSN
jgi:hypothetical protein